MAPDRWQQIIDVFHAALDRDDISRQAFLDEACGHDATLRAEVEALVAAHHEAGSFGEQALVLPAREPLGTTSKLRDRSLHVDLPGGRDRRWRWAVLSLRRRADSRTWNSRMVSSMSPRPRAGPTGRRARFAATRSNPRQPIPAA